MHTIENDRLIAEFMGENHTLVKDLETGQDLVVAIVCVLNKGIKNVVPPKVFTRITEYHTSWDCLMPVVEKMWKITGHRNLFYQEVSEDLTIYSKEEAGSNLRKEVYSLVVEFIKWYNQNKED